MVATQKLYPRGTVKRIVKAHAGRNISKNADVLVRPSILYLLLISNVLEDIQTDFAIDISRLHVIHARVRPIPDPTPYFTTNPFSLYNLLTYSKINRLMREASIRSRKVGEKGISARNIRRVTEVNILVPFYSLQDTDSGTIE